MNDRQKGTVLALLKADEKNRNYVNHYWFSYEDYLDPAEDFTEFSCERSGGKRGYAALIEHLIGRDGTARVFAQVYGLEDDDDEQYIYADTLIIFSRLPLDEIKQIFNERAEISPSDIGEETNVLQRAFLIDDHGERIPGTELFHDGSFVYYCWWD